MAICPIGSYCLSGATPTPCPVGTYGSGIGAATQLIGCLACAQGSFCLSGTGVLTSSQLCPAGMLYDLSLGNGSFYDMFVYISNFS